MAAVRSESGQATASSGFGGLKNREFELLELLDELHHSQASGHFRFEGLNG